MSDTPHTPPETPQPQPHGQPTASDAPATAGTGAPEAAAPSGPGDTASAEPGPDQLKAIIAVLQADLETSKTDVLRLVADMDNLRKRTEREKQDMAKFAISKFAEDIVGVADNFERALAAVPAGAAEADPALSSLVEGVSMTERQLQSVLEKHGVKRIWPEGEMMNPHVHQAMMQQDNPDVPPGTILQVFQAGYIIAERVVRPAVVVVAKGGPKTPKPEQAADGAGGDTPASATQTPNSDTPENQ